MGFGRMSGARLFLTGPESARMRAIGIGGCGMRAGLVLGALLAIVVPLAAHAQGTLRVGMQDDPDVLDPARGGTFAGRIVFAAACDKLIDVDQSLAFIPQLATAWAWSPDALSLTLTLRDGVRFQDGAALDANAVQANLDRYRSAPESVRKAELKSIESVEVVDPHTVRLRLSHPDAPLLAVLADRAGIMLSPASFSGGTRPELPVCAGPFRVVRRVAQDRIELERFAEYWNVLAIHLDRVVFRPIGDSGVRLLNLRAGQLDILEELAPTDVEAVQSAANLRLQRATSLGYETISINIGHPPGNTAALAHDPRVREALNRAIDREVLNAVVMNGQYVPANQAQAPDTRYWNPDHPVPPRDVSAARALLRQAGLDRVPLTLNVTNTPRELQLAEVIQSMAAEAGFDVTIRALEVNAHIQAMNTGDYQASVVVWSGRADPDANVSLFLACDGFQNWSKYCVPSFDGLLARARAVTDTVERRALYRQVASAYLADRPYLILFHMTWLWAHNDRLQGFTPTPDGLLRMPGLRLE